jgi:hypothetical protein
MLETGDTEYDGFALILRKNRFDTNAIAKIVETAQKSE